MGVERRELVVVPNFLGGYNTFDHPLALANNQMASGSQNTYVTQSKVQVRGGQTAIGSPAGSDSCTGIYEGVNGAIITWSDGDVDTLSGTTYTNRGSGVLADALVSFTSYDDFDIYADGTNVRTWNGSSEAALGGSPPAYPFLVTYQNHVWLFDDSSATARFSLQEDPETWPANNAIQIEKGADNITGAVAMFDRIVVFKERSIHHILGFDILSFQRIRISEGIGCVSHYSIQNVEHSPNPQWNGLYWVDRDGIYFSPNGGQSIIKISAPIQPTFDAFVSTNLCTSVPVRRQDQIWFSFRESGQSFNNVVLAWNYRYGIWDSIYTNCNFRGMGELVRSSIYEGCGGQGDSSSGRDVFELGKGTSDDGTAISMNLTTKQFAFIENSYGQDKVLRKLTTLHDVDTGGDLTVAMTKDFDSSDDGGQTIDMDANTGKVTYNQVVKTAQFALTQATLDVQTGIRQVEIEFTPKDRPL